MGGVRNDGAHRRHDLYSLRVGLGPDTGVQPYDCRQRGALGNVIRSDLVVAGAPRDNDPLAVDILLQLDVVAAPTERIGRLVYGYVLGPIETVGPFPKGRADKLAGKMVLDGRVVEGVVLGDGVEEQAAEVAGPLLLLAEDAVQEDEFVGEMTLPAVPSQGVLRIHNPSEKDARNQI